MARLGLLLLVAAVAGAGLAKPAAASENVQSHFEALVRTADRLFAELGNEAASIALLRAALLVCASCAATKSKGHFSERAFVFDDYPDRRYLAHTLLPALFSQHSPKQVLWVGVQPYTLRGVYQMAEPGVEVTTIEPDATHALWGSPSHHIVAPLQDLLYHAQPASFDAIVINGVIGWGIDGEEAVREAVAVMHEALREGGVLIVGWNKGMGTCCNFAPHFASQGLGSLPAEYEVPESSSHHVYHTLVRQAVRTR